MLELFRMAESFSDRTLDLLLLARTVAGLVLIFASVPKLTSPGKFSQIVQEYQLLPNKFARVAGRILPLIELACGFALLLGISTPWPGVVAMLLFALFAGAISINLLRGRRFIQCGCFGVGRETRLSWGSVLRNVTLGGVAFLSRGAPISSGCISLRGCAPNPIAILPIGQTATIMISGIGILSLWGLFGTIRKLGKLPGRGTYFLASGNSNSGSRSLPRSDVRDRGEII